MAKKRKTKVKLHYYNYPNIGDIMNPMVIHDLFHMEAVEEKHIKAEMIAIGSVLDRLLVNGKVAVSLAKMNVDADKKKKIHVWGTGFMYEYKEKQEWIRPVEIHALRGALSAEVVSKIQGKPCNVVLADPGLLASKLVREKVEKKYEIGIIPHYVDAQEPVFQQMKEKYPNSIIINVKDEPMEVLKQIASCKCTVSTSLHGLIISDSFGIPNQWCVVSNRILGDNYKFRDYYSSFGVEPHMVDLRTDPIPEIEDIKNNYSIKKSMVRKKQRQLMDCFPYNKTIWQRIKRKIKKVFSE